MTIQEFFRLSQQEQWDALYGWAQGKHGNKHVGITCDARYCPLSLFFTELDDTYRYNVLYTETRYYDPREDGGFHTFLNSSILISTISDIDLLYDGKTDQPVTASQVCSVLSTVRHVLPRKRKEEQRYA